MTPSPYPRPDAQRIVVGGTERSLGIMTIVVGCLGTASGLEVMIVGEELSTLGAHLLALTNNEGIVGPDVPGHDALRAFTGPVAFVLSMLRISTGIGLLRGTRWGVVASMVFFLPFLLLDVACFSFPWIVMAAMVNVAIILLCRGRLKS